MDWPPGSKSGEHKGAQIQEKLLYRLQLNNDTRAMRPHSLVNHLFSPFHEQSPSTKAIETSFPYFDTTFAKVEMKKRFNFSAECCEVAKTWRGNDCKSIARWGREFCELIFFYSTKQSPFLSVLSAGADQKTQNERSRGAAEILFLPSSVLLLIFSLTVLWLIGSLCGVE